jgi:hypothetical protein
MKTFVKNTLLAMTLSTSMVLADDKTTTMLNIDKVLPRTVSVDLPEFSEKKGTAWTSYSPQQRASIVGLELTANVAPLPVDKFSSVKYSPLQMAKIVGLKLTAEEVEETPAQRSEEASSAYSPQQRAKIAGLVLTAE